MSSETQGWDSRFDEDVEQPTRGAHQGQSQSKLLKDTFTMMRSEIPFIKANSLRFQNRIGMGSTYEVTRELRHDRTGGEPYFVAVKRLIPENPKDDDSTQDQLPPRRLRSVVRELRVLTHPKLKRHSCLAGAVAWGWKADTWTKSWPFLVMDWSEPGSLAQFATRRLITLNERRFLALDVATGLSALHDAGVVHGDVKLENVLVYGSQNNDRHLCARFTAKLSDFGSAIFEYDQGREIEHYLGTPKYNAPEIYGWDRKASDMKPDIFSAFELFKAAECYAFGLLLWGLVKEGEPFDDRDWRKSGETIVDCLKRLYSSKDNALLEKANEFFDQVGDGSPQAEKYVDSKARLVKNPTWQLYMRNIAKYQAKELEELKATPDPEILQTFRGAVSLCLRDLPQERGNIHEIKKKLDRNSEYVLPDTDGDHPGPRSLLPQVGGTIVPEAAISLLNPRGPRMLRDMFKYSQKPEDVFQVKLAEGMNQLVVRENLCSLPSDSNLQMARLPPRRETRHVVVMPETYNYGSEDMLQTSIKPAPDWHVQARAAENMRNATTTETDSKEKSKAHFQLAVMYHVGYGVAPDDAEVLNQLQAASKDNEVARAILGKMRPALETDMETRPRYDTGRIELLASSRVSSEHITYTNPVIQLDGVVERDVSTIESTSRGQPFTLGSLCLESVQTFSLLVKRNRLPEHDLCQALTVACRDGRFDAAMLIASHCEDLSTMDLSAPNPLHWLIMFSPEEAMQLFHALSSKRVNSVDLMKLWLDTQPGELKVTLPHRSMELQGTPLHWAVRARYTELVRMFLDSGADVNIRTKGKFSQPRDFNGFLVVEPSLSALDIAATYHFPETVELLLSYDCEIWGGFSHWDHSPLHMIGYQTLPFARYVAHGAEHRQALRETLRILVAHGIDINITSAQNETPLFIAIKNVDVPLYIMEELIAAGAVPGAECEEADGNAVISAIMCCSERRLSCSKIPLLVPFVADINDGGLKGSKLNALHLCARLDAVSAAEILLRIPGIDVDAKDGIGTTAVVGAAQMGSLGVLGALIRSGADLHHGDPLNAALTVGNMDAVVLLVEGGAGIWTGPRRDERDWNILHHAVSRHSGRMSYVRRCLEVIPQLRTREACNNPVGWSPLHQATNYTDVDGVSALVETGLIDTSMFKPKLTPYLRMTPFDLVTKQLEDSTYIEDGRRRMKPHYDNSDRLRVERGNLVNPTLEQFRGIESRFVDSLVDIINILRRAGEKET